MPSLVTIPDLVIKDTISFSCYGIGIINNVVNGTLIGISDGANLRDPTTAAINHSNIYAALPIVPAPTPNDFTKYNYLVIKLTNNSIIEIGIPWVNISTLVRLTRQSVSVLVNDFDGNTQRLKDILNDAGYLNLVINII